MRSVQVVWKMATLRRPNLRHFARIWTHSLRKSVASSLAFEMLSN